jgi:phosphate acyltransferase
MSNIANVIALDLMGSDRGPNELMEGALLALNQPTFSSHLVLVGNESMIVPFLKSKGLESDKRLSIHPALDVIGMDEKPVQSLKKKEASMVKGLELVKSGQAHALLSCGNTGSLMAGGMIKLRPMDGIDRPALASVIPTQKNCFILIDAGANPEAEAHNLLQNAFLGSHYAEVILKKTKPKVCLLTIGTEEGKGTTCVNEAHSLLKQMNGLLNYGGLIEGFSLFDGEVDVVVCDGFVGNILLKSWESVFVNMKDFIKEELMKNVWRKLGAFLSQGAFKEVKQRLSPECYGGAPLLGLKATVMKAHGSSNRHAIMHALKITQDVLRYNLNEHIQSSIQEANLTLNQGNIPLS